MIRRLLWRAGAVFAATGMIGVQLVFAHHNPQPKLIDNKKDLYSSTPLTRKQHQDLKKSLKGRTCPCPCGLPLASCFGCSMAKSEHSEAERLVRKGLSSVEVKMELDPPVVILVWFDYTDPEGRSLLRLLDKLRKRHGRSIRVLRRYFPADIEKIKGWKDTINAVEIARAAGRYDAAHQLLIRNDGRSWIQKIRRLPGLLGLDRDDFERGIDDSRFEAQIRKDITAAHTQYGVTESPTLEVDGESYEGNLSLEALSEWVKNIIIKKSL